MKSDHPYMLSLAAENLSVVLCMAHSKPNFYQLRGNYQGIWKSLDRLLFELPEKRADRSLLEMAYLTRAVDDAEGISQQIKSDLGTLYMRKNGTSPLDLREACNKIIHAASYDWRLHDPKNPTVVCIGEDQEKWTHAEISLNGLVSAFGQLAL